VKLQVLVTTHNRPVFLRRLLIDLAKEVGITVTVYDDASDASTYGRCRALVAANGWRWVRSEVRHGKERWWEWVSRIFADQIGADEDFFVFLPDDVRLCRGFINRVLAVWNSVVDPKKVGLNLLRDNRDVCWVKSASQKVNGQARASGWIDGCFLCTRQLFELLDWSITPMRPNRWRSDPTLSSGVWCHVSLAMERLGRTLYCTNQSLVAHIQGDSVMYPGGKSGHRAVDFIDGDLREKLLASPDMIYAGMATIPDREALAAEVIKKIEPQVDELFVHVNGGFGKGLTDRGKFKGCDLPGYHLMVDDDIDYPDDYVEKLLLGVEHYDRRNPVGVHAQIMVEPIVSYYKSRIKFPCVAGLEASRKVHVLGTGTLAYHSSSIRITVSDLKSNFMADVWFALIAKAQGVDLFAIARDSNWIKLLEQPKTTIYECFKANDTEQTKLIQTGRPWPPLL
jgi:hypothetical protein